MDENNNMNSNFAQNSLGAEMRRNGYYQEFQDGSKKMLNFTSPPQPTFDSEEFRGSMQQALSENIGEYVVIEFLIGTEQIIRKQGLLYFVGRSYVTLYDEQVQNFIVCDIFSIKFVYFYLPGQRPKRNFNILPGNNGGGNSNSR